MISINTIKQHNRLRDEQTLTSQPHQDDITFPFLVLPGEMRNTVYECALVDKKHSVWFETARDKQNGSGK
jgi:hypothetical protein